MIGKIVALSAGVLVMASAGDALAHHSGAMFDSTKEVTIQGVVKEFQYTNPHSWLEVVVTGSNNAQVIWSFEAEGPSTLMRAGMRKSSLVPGDKVTVKGRPLKDGRPAAALVSVIKADGTFLSPRPGATRPGAAVAN